jgi:hypothetical protein
MHVPHKKKISISHDEWFVIGAITLLAAVLICLLPVVMKSLWFTNLVPPFQYILYNIGFILLTVVLIGAPISHLLKQKVHLLTMLRSGISTWLIFSFIMDLWQPPFAYSTSGTLLISGTESLIGTSVDYMLGWMYTNVFSTATLLIRLPLFGNMSLLFLLIYFITPILSVICAALLFQPKVLAKVFWQNAQ